MSLTQPSLIPQPWASDGSYTAIPQTTDEAGRASWAVGFPPETAQPLGAGGIPPHWLDFQGVLFALSNHAVFEQAGGHYTWSNTLDYPKGACIVGSDGNVYQALQDSGPNSAAGAAKNPTASAGAAYWGRLATPDGSTIKINSAGKLTVDFSNLADGLADGTTITANNGKLSSQAASAASLADGITTVASNGKLTVNLTNVTPTALKKISQYIGDANAGLVMNGTTGKLQINFSSVGDAVKDDIRASLDMKVPLRANKNLYVDPSDADASDGNWGGANPGPATGETPDTRAAQKFVTIQACVNFAASTYSVGNYHINIRIAAGTYNESLTLPEFDRGSGYIELIPAAWDASEHAVRDVTIAAPLNDLGTRETPVAASGGAWRLYYIDAYRIENATSQVGTARSCYAATGSAVLNLYGCSARQKMPSSPTPLGGQNYNVHVLYADDGGTINLEHGVIAGAIEAEKPSSGTPVVYAIQASRGGRIGLRRGNDSGTPATSPNIVCSGSCDVFLLASQEGGTSISGAGTLTTFVGTMTGKRYQANSGSFIVAGPAASYFPGDTAGTLDNGEGGRPQTYCWYSENDIS